MHYLVMKSLAKLPEEQKAIKMPRYNRHGGSVKDWPWRHLSRGEGFKYIFKYIDDKYIFKEGGRESRCVVVV